MTQSAIFLNQVPHASSEARDAMKKGFIQSFVTATKSYLGSQKAASIGQTDNEIQVIASIAYDRASRSRADLFGNIAASYAPNNGVNNKKPETEIVGAENFKPLQVHEIIGRTLLRTLKELGKGVGPKDIPGLIEIGTQSFIEGIEKAQNIDIQLSSYPLVLDDQYENASLPEESMFTSDTRQLYIHSFATRKNISLGYIPGIHGNALFILDAEGNHYPYQFMKFQTEGEVYYITNVELPDGYVKTTTITGMSFTIENGMIGIGKKKVITYSKPGVIGIDNTTTLVLDTNFVKSYT